MTDRPASVVNLGYQCDLICDLGRLRVSNLSALGLSLAERSRASSHQQKFMGDLRAKWPAYGENNDLRKKVLDRQPIRQRCRLLRP